MSEMEVQLLALKNFDGLRIEIIGDEIWVSGATRSYCKALKAVGFNFAPLKKMWHWSEKPHNASNHLPITQIRSKYGSRVVRTS